jgi:threonyl-tRNA synthetase
VFNKLEEYDIRGFVDHRDEKIGRKIRDAEIKKIPMMLIIGEKEQNEGKVAVRKHKSGDLGSFSFDEFVSFFRKEVDASFDEAKA